MTGYLPFLLFVFCWDSALPVTAMLLGQSNTPEHRRKINVACEIYFLRSDVAVLRQLTRYRRTGTQRSLRSGEQYCERETAGKKLTAGHAVA